MTAAHDDRHRFDAAQATAENLAGWHEASVAALGLRSARTPDAWWALEPAPPMYFPYIALRPSATPEDAAQRSRHAADVLSDRSRFVGVCDPTGSLDLSAAGFLVGDAHPWMLRAPTLADEPTPAGEPARPPGLEITTVSDADQLAEFELASVNGFGIEPVPRFSLHAPPILDDARFHLRIGRVDGRVVSVAMSFVHGGVSGVYGVATIPSARRRGYGAALTSAALAAAPDIPSVLQPSAMGEAVYRRLGYERFTTFATWYRPPEGASR